ncbi:hypothetical protein SAMN05421776_101565 [Nocardia farcinica]|uniref:Lipoprotein n=1 Tax=Nocardia farcinica TaxID=37329 RepID=A0A0H5NZ46_NOCFR|nr:hypothetical protein CJ469_06366 [Nocardia farcinica]CRY75386.1 Uncharacterised protein [Nocardia farcinica]SIS67209.1 hypothetical protein SAMN05421776_101565 [Nocardia farcinica]
MRYRSVLIAAALSVAAVSITACGPKDTSAACSGETFNLHSHPELLGAENDLVRAFDEAAEQQLASATMVEMTTRAGWSPEWERVVYIGARTTDEELRKDSAADLRLACFAGLPTTNSDPDLRSSHVTLFVADGKPLQAVWWVGQTPSLRFGKRDFLLPDTVLRYDPDSRTMRAE